MPGPTPLPPSATSISVKPSDPTLTATPVVMPEETFTPTPDVTPTVTSSPVSDPHLKPDDVLLLPQPLYEGDRLSIDIVPSIPVDFDWGSDALSVTLTHPSAERMTAAVAPLGLGTVPRARFYWLDDPLSAGTLFYTFTLQLSDGVFDHDLENNQLVVPLSVLPRETLPPPEPVAQWAVTETAGFLLHYLTGSAAERDLSTIITTSMQAHSAVSGQFDAMDAMSISPSPDVADVALDVYLLDRVVGQGGYASGDWVAISYTDRNYAPVSLDVVLRHELAHALDHRVGCDGAPAMLREGLAVVLAGGHYRREALQAKAAALYETPRYVPIVKLVEDFYMHQHEIGYLEAGAILDYLIRQRGWGIVPELCRATSSADGDDAVRWEAALAETGLVGSTALERQWHNWLHNSNVTSYDARLLQLELNLMDMMRDYQLAYDPAAHFLRGILFSPADARRLGIVADFVRRPRTSEAITLEMLLAMGQEAVTQGDVLMGEILLSELREAMALGLDKTVWAASVLSLTRDVLALGLEPYGLILETDTRMRVFVLDRVAWPAKAVLTAHRHQPGAPWALSDRVWEE
jgi:hypothetical protein